MTRLRSRWSGVGVLAAGAACACVLGCGVKRVEYTAKFTRGVGVDYPPEGDAKLTDLPARFVHAVGVEGGQPTYPAVSFDVPAGTYMARIESDVPVVVKVWVVGGLLEVSGGFDLPTPVCMHFCVTERGCGRKVEGFEGSVSIGAIPIGKWPTWIAITIERTSERVPLGLERWTCPEKAGGPDARADDDG